MSLESRIARLEKCAGPVEPDEPPPEPWTDAQRVQALRYIAGRMRPWTCDGDPFPHLEGAEYIVAFWPWLLEHGEPWPAWAQRRAVWIAHPDSRYAARQPGTESP